MIVFARVLLILFVPLPLHGAPAGPPRGPGDLHLPQNPVTLQDVNPPTGENQPLPLGPPPSHGQGPDTPTPRENRHTWLPPVSPPSTLHENRALDACVLPQGDRHYRYFPPDGNVRQLSRYGYTTLESDAIVTTRRGDFVLLRGGTPVRISSYSIISLPIYRPGSRFISNDVVERAQKWCDDDFTEVVKSYQRNSLKSCGERAIYMDSSM